MHPFDGGLLFNPGYIVPKLVKTNRRNLFFKEINSV